MMVTMTTPVRKFRKSAMFLAAVACVALNFWAVNDWLTRAGTCRGLYERESDNRAVGPSYRSIARLYDDGDTVVGELECEDLRALAEDERRKSVVEENKRGNRGVFFVSLETKGGGGSREAVMKEANRDTETRAQIYKYNTAIREIEILRKMQGEPGIPRFYGSCIESTRVSYVVEKIDGFNMCNDNGTTWQCARGGDLVERLVNSDNPALSALTLAYNTAKVFSVLEDHHYLFEDISGLNMMINSKWKLFIVDVDSFIFYNSTRLFSELSCTRHVECYGPIGKLWGVRSLNAKIYQGCNDLGGICEDFRCRGYGASLHACGISKWFLCNFSLLLESLPSIHGRYEKVCECLSQADPSQRCSFKHAFQMLDELLRDYF